MMLFNGKWAVIWSEFIMEYSRFILTLKKNEKEILMPTKAFTYSSEGSTFVASRFSSGICGGNKELIENPSGIGAFFVSLGNMKRLVFQKETLIISYKSPYEMKRGLSNLNLSFI